MSATGSGIPELFTHQENFLNDVPNLGKPARALLFYKTGAGKSLTAMLGMKQLGYTDVLVIAPPSTHLQWVSLGWELDMKVDVMSHAKFRMKDTKMSRTRALIADEFHMFGGQKGQGWRKLDKLAEHLNAPLFLLSATPNYNDAERCYCIQHVLDPRSCRGGFLQFIYQHCVTEQNPFGMEPKVLGFTNHPDAAGYLASLPGVYYLPDDLAYTIQDIPYQENIPDEMALYGFNRRKGRMVASIIEEAHAVRYQGLVGDDGFLHRHVLTEVLKVMKDSGPVLIYANHATVAEATARTLGRSYVPHLLVTGSTTKGLKDKAIERFRTGRSPVLVGTATLATGTDGLDRVCDTLLILDDTDDDALRRQLIGRIMPRGDMVLTSAKQVFRLVPA